MDILGIEKFNEMVKNKELVEDNTVLVNAEGKIVGLADDTLEEGTVAVDQDGNTIPIVSSAEGAYNPVFQFMYNGKIYDYILSKAAQRITVLQKALYLRWIYS